jgi:hypothetical protein
MVARSLALLLLGLTGCFSPKQPACAFSCADDGICPAGYSCQADRVCHRDDDPDGACVIPPQQIDGSDAPVADGGAADAGDASDAAPGDGP